MKTPAILLTAALAISLTGAGWLLIENHRLRQTLAAQPAFAPVRPGLTGPRTSSPFAPRESRSPAYAGKQDSTASPTRSANSPADASGQKPVAALFTVSGNEDGTVTLTDTTTLDKKITTPDVLSTLAREAQVAALEHTAKRPGGPSWSPGQAAGAPNTETHGDFSTAWASQQPDGGKEWLRLKYETPVEVSEVNIHETYNPGAVSKVSAVLPDGSQRVLWEGTGSSEEGIIERAVKVPPGIRSDQILVELDTARVPGWNEIDAVELVGRDGTRQWAAESTASSYYGQGRFGADTLGMKTLGFEGVLAR
jgi:hypothetical protein